MLLQKPASSWRHYTEYLCLRLCANQPISPRFQSEHFWKVPSNMHVDISSTHHTTSQESPLQRIILLKSGWLLLNNNQNPQIYTSIYIHFETVNLHLLTSEIHRYLIGEIQNWFISVLLATEQSLKLNYIFTLRIFQYEYANAGIFIVSMSMSQCQWRWRGTK